MIKGILVFLLILLLVLIGPFLVIASLNTLFQLEIDYNFWTWLSVVILSSFFNSGRIGQKND